MEGADFRLVLPLLGSSWNRLEGRLGRLGALLGRLGVQLAEPPPRIGCSKTAAWDTLGPLLGLSWAFLEPPCGLKCPSVAKRGECKHIDVPKVFD